MTTIIATGVARPTNMALALMNAAVKTGLTASAPWTARRVAENCDRERSGTVIDTCTADLKLKTRQSLGL